MTSPKSALGSLGIPSDLAEDLLDSFQNLGRELRRGTLEKATAGKFVETVVQALQCIDPIESGYDKHVDVEKSLRDIYESRTLPGIDDSSRLGIVRSARTIYTMRSKRGMVHKGETDPNKMDLKLCYHSAQWILSEFVVQAKNIPPDDAHKMIEQLQRDVTPVLQHIHGRPLVLEDMTVREELLTVLYDAHPTVVDRSYLSDALDRRAESSISQRITELREERLLDGDAEKGYVLTATGIDEAEEVVESYG